jgi:hypothetical protein
MSSSQKLIKSLIRNLNIDPLPRGVMMLFDDDDLWEEEDWDDDEWDEDDDW